MKGLTQFPTQADLLKAYNRLQGAKEVGLKTLILYSQWSRLDPRLAEILVGHLRTHWTELPLGKLIVLLNEQPWPRAMIVLLRFVELTLPRKEAPALRHLIAALEESLAPSPVQLFFIPLQKPNAVVLRHEVDFRTEPYTFSGFIGSQTLLPRSQPPAGRTLLGKAQRLSILNELMSTKQLVSVAEYIAACHGLVSPRQAQRDLKAFAGVKPRGYTRNRRYSCPILKR